MEHWKLGWAALAVVALYPAMATGDTLESVQKKVIEQSKTITSLASQSTYVMDEENGAVKTRSHGTTSYEYVKKDKIPLYRVETSYTSEMEMDGSKQATKGTSLTVCDGEFLHIYSENNGTKSVMKQKAQPHDGGLIEQSYFDTMAQSYGLELLPDATVGSRTTYVIKAVLKQKLPIAASEQLLYFDKKTGVMLKSVSKNAAGKVTMETNTTDLKVDSTISPDRFVFHAPEGVPVTDLTQQPVYGDQPSEGAQKADVQPGEGETDAKDESPKDKSKKDESVKSEDKNNKDKIEKKEKKLKWPKLPKKKWP